MRKANSLLARFLCEDYLTRIIRGRVCFGKGAEKAITAVSYHFTGEGFIDAFHRTQAAHKYTAFGINKRKALDSPFDLLCIFYSRSHLIRLRQFIGDLQHRLSSRHVVRPARQKPIPEPGLIIPPSQCHLSPGVCANYLFWKGHRVT